MHRPAPRAAIAIVATLVLALLAIPAAAAAKKKPKLRIASVSKVNGKFEVGESLGVEGKIKNKGKKKAKGAKLKLVVSGSGVKNLKIGSETRKGKIKPKKKKSFVLTGRIPDELDPGAEGDPYAEGGPYKVSACVRQKGKKGPFKCKKAKGSFKVVQDAPPEPPVNFTPGSKSLGDELFPQIGNGGYDAIDYALDLRYNPVANTFGGGTKTTMTAEATQNLSRFSLDFQDLAVSSVTVNGQPATFTQEDATPEFAPDVPEATQPMKLTITPAEGIRDGETFTTVVNYSGTPQVITDADTSIEGWIPACYPLTPPQTCDGAFVVNEPIGAQGWFPNNNHPTDKATFETKITVPQQYVALGIGELVSNTVSGANRTWTWSEDDPSATYLTTGTVGLFDYTEEEMVEASTGETLDVYNAIDSSATQLQKDTINAAMDQQPGMLNFLSDVLGPYPFDSTGVVADRASGVGYALEVQTKSHFAGGFSSGNPSVGLSTLLHEIAHQWLGNSVSPSQWKDIWFNEGYATFMEIYYDFQVNGGDTPAEYFDSIYNDPTYDWSLAPAELDNDPANLFASPTYERSSAMLAGFYEIVGENRFFSFARRLENQNKYGNITTVGFIEDAVTASGLSGAEADQLEEYFQQWLFGETQPTLTPADF